jgi:XTP/dITP diphosphohydrolase
MVEILLATRSAGKIREIRDMVAGRGWTWRGLDDFPDIPEVEETGGTFSENARLKALQYAAASGLHALADDSGLEVDSLGGEPGVHSAYYGGRPRDDAANNRRLVDALRGVPVERRTGRFRCVMVFARPGAVLLETSGLVEGVIIDQPRGQNGFGYDPHFLLPERGLTTAELAPGEKHAVSHRGRALRAMLAQLETYFNRPNSERGHG